MTRGIIAASMTVVLAGSLLGQDSAQHRRCRDPHPAPVCAGYLLLEYNAGMRMAGTTVRTTYGREDALDSWFAWDVGWMKNWAPRSSIGNAFEIGGSSDGVRLALRGKTRRWLSHEFAVDASAGPLMTQFQTGDGVRPTYGLTADVGVGRARLVFLTIGVDVAQQTSVMQVGMHAGGRAESRGAALISAIAAIGGLLVMAAFRDGNLRVDGG